MAALSRSNFPKGLVPGINYWLRTTSMQAKEQWPEIFKQESVNRAWVEGVKRYGFTAATEKLEGTDITELTGGGEGPNRITRIRTWAGSFSVTMEAAEDDLYGGVIKDLAPSFMRSFITAREIRAMRYFNNPTSGSYTLADGQPLLSVSRPLATGATQANTLAASALFSEAALEDLLVLQSLWVDDTGVPIVVRNNALLIHPSNIMNVTRVLQADNQSNTESNNPNAIRVLGMVPKVVMNNYLAGQNDYFLINDLDGLKMFRRKPFTKKSYEDEKSGDLVTTGVERYEFDHTNELAVSGVAN